MTRSGRVLRQGGYPVHPVRGLVDDQAEGGGDCVSVQAVFLQKRLLKMCSDGKISVKEAAESGYQEYKKGAKK